MANQTAQLDWREGRIPVSRRFDDPYFSLEDGLAETAHVFLSGNDLPARFVDGFQIAELGFGSGLNFLTTWQAWEDAAPAGRLLFTSFEAYPMHHDDMAKALKAFPSLAPKADQLIDALKNDAEQVSLNGVDLRIVIGDARTCLPDWPGKADAWFLDGFAPAKNPELWEPELLKSVADHTKPGGTAATYTAAGHVRRALSDAGFDVERVTGFGRKRHMTLARKPS